MMGFRSDQCRTNSSVVFETATKYKIAESDRVKDLRRNELAKNFSNGETNRIGNTIRKCEDKREH